MYCSDVSGAFDKVSSEKLLQKLSSQGVHPSVINVLESWLAKRRANVVVGGVESINILMQDMVYQGTVWGPVLWNSFFADAVQALIKAKFESIVYADDLNAYHLFPNQTEQSVIDRSLRSCQDELHKWGRGNRVTFDPKKESFHTVSRVHPQGDGFKILGIAFDCQLLMHDTIDELCTQCCWKLRTLLRSRRFFTTGEIVLHFKSHILSFIEYRTPAITHAADSAIASVNGVQERFLRDIGVSALDALLHFKLAPLAARRDIANLGIIHRAILGLGPRQLQKFFQLSHNPEPVRSLRYTRYHDRQVLDPFRPLHRDYINRSTLGYIAIYNWLPNWVVCAESVSCFQGRLQSMMVDVAQSGFQNWDVIFSNRIPSQFHPLRSL